MSKCICANVCVHLFCGTRCCTFQQAISDRCPEWSEADVISLLVLDLKLAGTAHFYCDRLCFIPFACLDILFCLCWSLFVGLWMSVLEFFSSVAVFAGYFNTDCAILLLDAISCCYLASVDLLTFCDMRMIGCLWLLIWCSVTCYRDGLLLADFHIGTVAFISLLYLLGAQVVALLIRNGLRNYKTDYIWDNMKIAPPPPFCVRARAPQGIKRYA